MDLPKSFVEDFRLIRQQSPVIYNITNYVAMNFSANALLSIGASPLMSSEPEEAEELVQSSDALVINTGCLEKTQAQAMYIAAEAAQKEKKPWVLDPAGTGLSRIRMAAVKRLIMEFHPSLIRGNASEIMAIIGSAGKTHGLDATSSSEEATESAVKLAKESGAVVSVSGETDYITDGKIIISITGGSPIMSKVTATGCTASAICAAFLAVDKDIMAAASGAMALLGASGEITASISSGPGTFAANFIDSLALADPEKVLEKIHYGEKQA